MKASDFAETIEGRQTGRNSITISISVYNPTDRNICVYDAITGLVDIEKEGRDGSRISSLPDDGYEGVRSDPSYNPSREEISRMEAVFMPDKVIEPGQRRVFTEIMDFGRYVYLHAPADNGVGMQFLDPPSGRYHVKMRGFQVFLCDRLNFFIKRKIRNQILSFDRGGLRDLSAGRRNGIHWKFHDVIGSPFKFKPSGPPPGYQLIIVD